MVQTRYQLSESALLAAAHNPSNTQMGRRRSAEMYADMHFRRTGERVDPQQEMKVGDEDLAFTVYGCTAEQFRPKTSVPSTRCFPIHGKWADLSDSERRELTCKRIAHNPNVLQAKRLEAAQEMASLHLARTGEEIDAMAEARVGNDSLDFIV